MTFFSGSSKRVLVVSMATRAVLKRTTAHQDRPIPTTGGTDRARTSLHRDMKLFAHVFFLCCCFFCFPICCLLKKNWAAVFVVGINGHTALSRQLWVESYWITKMGPRFSVLGMFCSRKRTDRLWPCRWVVFLFHTWKSHGFFKCWWVYFGQQKGQVGEP